MIIAVDFDGTCVEHQYPDVGPDVPHAVEVLDWLVREGHELIIYTMRSGLQLSDAIMWFNRKGILISGVQYSKGQTNWTVSNKCYAHIYIDDSALGAPLIKPKEGRTYIDWLAVKAIMVKIQKENLGEIIRR